MDDFRTDLKLILTEHNVWSPLTFLGMGGSSSKKTDNVVADSVDFSTIMSKDFAVLRLHGGTSALVAGVAAKAILLYLAYRTFMLKKAGITARRGTRQDEECAVWGNPGRGDHEDRAGQGRFARRPPTAFMPPRAAAALPPQAHINVCDYYREEAGYDVLRGHFQPPTVHPP